MNATETPTQTEFDFLCPRKTDGVMAPKQIAEALQFDLSTVYDMVITGELEALRRPGAEKTHIRITRRSFIAWCIRAALTPPDEFIATLTKLAGTLDARQRRELIARLSSLQN